MVICVLLYPLVSTLHFKLLVGEERAIIYFYRGVGGFKSRMGCTAECEARLQSSCFAIVSKTLVVLCMGFCEYVCISEFTYVCIWVCMSERVSDYILAFVDIYTSLFMRITNRCNFNICEYG